MPLLQHFQFKKHSEMQQSFFKTSIKSNQNSFCKDFQRNMIGTSFFINGKKIEISRDRLQALGVILDRNDGNNYKETRKAFLTILSENGIDLSKLSEKTVDLLIHGFHQEGYVNAMENALTLGLGGEKGLNPSASRMIHIFQDDKTGEVNVTETVNVHLITDPRVDKEMSLAQNYESIKDRHPERDSQFPSIATVNTTYTFSNNEPSMRITEQVIKRKPENDKYKMLDRLPDERNLWEKFKEILANIFPKLAIPEPKGETLIKSKHNTNKPSF